MAERAGISTNHYQAISHACANPTMIVLIHLATALGVSISDLFESSPVPDDYRLVPVAHLRELTTAHEELLTVVKHLTTSST